MSVRILIGDARQRLKELPDRSVRMICTSPPYFGLRNYGHPDQMGLETTPAEYVAGMVGLFHEARRVLADDGTLWLNLGDSYAGSRCGPQGKLGEMADRSIASQRMMRATDGNHVARPGAAPKNLIGIPWRVAFALQDDGWILRQDIIWSKPNPMPESVVDRCTKSHEYIFLLSKSHRYYFDAAAIAEPIAASSVTRLAQDIAKQAGSDRVPGKTNGAMKAVGRSGNKERKPGSERGCPEGTGSNVCGSVPWEGSTRNKRSVWEVATQPFSEAHFATFPPALIEPCILAGSAVGDTVLDVFGGAGTTGLVADRHGRNAVLIELNPEYADIATRRLSDDAGMFAQVEAA